MPSRYALIFELPHRMRVSAFLQLLGIGYTADNLKPLVDLVGPSFAKEIMMTARLFDANEALAMGLINRVVARSVLEAYVADYTSTLTANAPLSIRAAKASINELVRDIDVRDMERARRLTSACYDSSDYEEGRTALWKNVRPSLRAVSGDKASAISSK